MRLTDKGGWRNPIDSDMINAMYNKLSAYEDAEEQGRLLILPKTLYEAEIMGVTEWKVTGAFYHDGAVESYEVQTKNIRAVMFSSEIGKTVFLSREEAEAALKGETKDV